MRPHVRHGLFGPNGNYLFELEAQPGGPEGRSDTKTGSQPIAIAEPPRNVRPLVLPFLWTGSWPAGVSSHTQYFQ